MVSSTVWYQPQSAPLTRVRCLSRAWEGATAMAMMMMTTMTMTTTTEIAMRSLQTAMHHLNVCCCWTPAWCTKSSQANTRLAVCERALQCCHRLGDAAWCCGFEKTTLVWSGLVIPKRQAALLNSPRVAPTKQHGRVLFLTLARRTAAAAARCCCCRLLSGRLRSWDIATCANYTWHFRDHRASVAAATNRSPPRTGWQRRTAGMKQATATPACAGGTGGHQG